ncbi:unnamed protein product [Acanthoscelides obtectus]|uniref:HTH psq-type domain-containing protein n=1 Tax=Acanthoscelides obtectus TaxID=200917 RepID=A0A9P0PGY7_ACAOB|nr:unnamed protein product [Acanthoscelides obtectus]CAK1681828.1 hypothetical protein AOBTE_LOCUS33295 [Acanthoscelides obtectus]
MPRKYIRSNTARPRATWSDEQLMEAVAKVQTGEISKSEAHRRYNVPPRTLKRRTTSGNFKKGILGRANETRLVAHIHRLSVVGFAPDRRTVRTLAFRFAEKLGIKHPFSAATEKAGFAWLHSFLDRNPELYLRQTEGQSLSRAQGMNRGDARRFYELLDEVLTKNGLMEKPSCIFNMDETGVQLQNKPSKVVTKKGSKDVHVLTSKERGENATVIACCSADGTFIPPVPELSDGLELFVQWLVEQFIPHKPADDMVEGDGPEFTPTKLLHEVSPVPVLPIPLFGGKKQVASVLNSPQNIEKLKQKNKTPYARATKNAEGRKKDDRAGAGPGKKINTHVKKDASKAKTCNNTWSSDDDEPLVKMIKKATSNAKVSNNTWTSDDDDEIPMKRAKNDGHDDNEYLCVECYEPYEQTTKWTG